MHSFTRECRSIARPSSAPKKTEVSCQQITGEGMPFWSPLAEDYAQPGSLPGRESRVMWRAPYTRKDDSVEGICIDARRVLLFSPITTKLETLMSGSGWGPCGTAIGCKKQHPSRHGEAVWYGPACSATLPVAKSRLVCAQPMIYVQNSTDGFSL